MFTKILVELVDMHQGLVWFPTVGTFVIAGPSNKELHTGSSMMISTMRYNISDQKFLLVLLSNTLLLAKYRSMEIQIVYLWSAKIWSRITFSLNT